MKKILLFMLLLASGMAIFNSCQYKFNVIPAAQLPDTTVFISFSTDILPIWNSAENCISCHTSGGQPPDLTPQNAYNDLFRLNLVDLQAPSQSLIYTFPQPETDTHVWKKYTGTEAALVLLWIKQGAKNN